MKTIGVITDGLTGLGRFITDNLLLILGGNVTINNYYISALTGQEVLNEDCILLMVAEKSVIVKNYVPDKRNIVIAQRTIYKRELAKIMAIPPQTDVLVVNDGYNMTMEMVALLYRLGVNHLNLIPYAESTSYDGIEYAITPGEPALVPTGIAHVIDTGDRSLDFATFVQILELLRIDSDDVHERLIVYAHDIVTPDGGIERQHRELFLQKIAFQTVLNLSNEGVLVLDKDNKVILYNLRLAQMLDVKGDVMGQDCATAFGDDIALLLNKTIAADELVKYRDKELLVNKKILHYPIGGERSYWHFQEVTYIRRLEENLNKRHSGKGLVARYSFEQVKTSSPVMQACINKARRFVDSELTVLLTGETGTGKEVFAQSIHQASNRRNHAFVAINCGSIPESLLESQLFGYVGGAFTGALKDGKAGWFEQANNGTIFLDEIGDMPLLLQARLLRILQEGQLMRVGSTEVISVNVRVIAATNVNIMELVDRKKFRKDLYYRLNILPLDIPPLRERKEDIPVLLKFFLAQRGMRDAVISDDAARLLLAHCWQGNIRELQNAAAYIAQVSDSEMVDVDHLPPYVGGGGGIGTDLSPQMLAVLRVLYEYKKIGKNIGRQGIAAALAVQGDSVTEGGLRTIISDLQRRHLVVSHVGPRGTCISALGEDIIRTIG